MIDAPKEHLRTRINLVKWAVTLVIAVSTFVYLLLQWKSGRIGIRVGNFYSWTGYYQWISYPSQRTVLSWTGGMISFLLVAGWWPKRLKPRTRFQVWLALTAALVWGISLGLMHLLQIYELPWLFWLMIFSLSSIGAFYMNGAVAGTPGLATFGLFLIEDRRFKIWAGLIALFALILYSAAFHTIFDGQPVMSDSQSQIAQARLLLSGSFQLHVSQSLRDVIAFPYGMETVPSYVQYPPGHIFLLMPPILAGLPPQTLNIVGGILTILFAMFLARALWGPAAGIATGLLLLASPLMLLMNSESMNHSTVSMELWLAAFFMMPRNQNSRMDSSSMRPWALFFGGLALGWAGMTRPLTAFAHGIVWLAVLLFALSNTLRSKGPRSSLWGLLRGPAIVFLGMIPVGLCFMVYNYRTTGNPFVLGYAVSNPELHRLGFHEATRPGGLGYTPMDAVRSLGADLAALNWQMFGLVFGSWMVMAAWWVRTRLTGPEIIIVLLILSQMICYKLYQFHDLYFGPRFLFELIPAFALLGGSAIGRIMSRNTMVAAVSAILLFLMIIGSAADGFAFWSRRFAVDVGQHRGLEDAMNKLLPNEEPLAIVIPDSYVERVGRWFPADRGAPPVWFIPAGKEAQARSLPELADARWVLFDSWTP